MRARVDMGWAESPEDGSDATASNGSLRSWLVRGNQGVNPRRGNGRHSRARQLLVADSGWLPGDRSGWRGLVNALQRHSLLSALSTLHRNDRQILTMAYLEGHTNLEISRILDVSVRTVSRRLGAALARLEEHARNAGIWIASLLLLALGWLTRPQERVANLVRSVQWQQAAGMAAAGTAVVALGLASSPPVAPADTQSTFSPSGRSISILSSEFGIGTPSAPAETTTLTSTEDGDGAPHNTKVHAGPAAPTSHPGCGPRPTDAPPGTPVRAHGTAPPVTIPGPRAHGCRTV